MTSRPQDKLKQVYDCLQGLPNLRKMVNRASEVTEAAFAATEQRWAKSGIASKFESYGVYTQWLVAQFASDPGMCTLHNHPAAYGCQRGEECTFNHICVFCGANHSGFARNSSSRRFLCKVHNALEEELANLEEKELGDDDITAFINYWRKLGGPSKVADPDPTPRAQTPESRRAVVPPLTTINTTHVAPPHAARPTSQVPLHATPPTSQFPSPLAAPPTNQFPSHSMPPPPHTMPPPGHYPPLFESIQPSSSGSSSSASSFPFSVRVGAHQQTVQELSDALQLVSNLYQQRHTLQQNVSRLERKVMDLQQLVSASTDRLRQEILSGEGLKNLSDDQLLQLQRQTIDELDKRKQCVICLQELCSIVFLPCKHMKVCEGCSPQLTHCPICRAFITDRFKPY
eukprot:gb/GEZN01008752.1/.p1 GENE.gb/GEZN01008752.1/~~gb/GEZN01008752.1/.p1  ORF type:complete len:400 (-),score=38.80 gb/GEZN01008752.1/:141-1340(-)